VAVERGARAAGGAGVDGLKGTMKNIQNRAKIMKVSKVIHAILFAGLILWGMGILGSLIMAVIAPFVSRNNPYWPDQLLFVRVFVSMTLCFVVNLNFLRFFGRLKEGKLFDLPMAENLKSAGKSWLGLWLFTVLTAAINCHQQPEMKITIDDLCDFSDLFAGSFVIIIAWLLKEAQELQEEQELTV